VFKLWLPQHVPHLGELLPGMLAWQAMLAGSLPTDILFVAAGKMRLLGTVRITGTALGLVTLALVLAGTGLGSLGIALAASALPAFLCGLWGELGPLGDVAPRRAVVIARYATCGLAACAGALFARHGFIVAAALAACGLVLLPSSLRTVWRLVRR
jgi:hypothetical protein